jgi:hypothetical protein
MQQVAQLPMLQQRLKLVPPKSAVCPGCETGSTCFVNLQQ